MDVILSGEGEVVDEVKSRTAEFPGGRRSVGDGRRRSRERSSISWCCLGLGSYLQRSDDVDEVEARVTTFSGEVVDLVVLPRVGVLSKENRGSRRSEGEGDDVLGGGR